MSALPTTNQLSSRIQSLQDQLESSNARPLQMPQLGQPRRPNNLGELTPLCTRKKTLNLPPFLQPVNATSRMKTETETKLREIMAGNGILKIAGVQYQTDVSELEDLGTLGNGTSGHVVRMRHPATDTTIAVKQMRRTGNIEENKRIIMDIDVVLKSHDCPYIVQCLGCFITECDVWICMELMKTCFDKLLKRLTQPVPESIMGKITVATVRALSYLKEKHDVIHRDIKPSNILIDEHGNIKLCDFGISGRLVDSKAKTRSAGCAAYMAPERIDLNKSEYDIRADVWSLGITLVELATGSNPYKGCNTDFEVLTRVLESDPPSLPKDRGFSVEFHMFVEKCLTKNHLKRPKYPELLEQPFIRHYERMEVDVRGWFASVMQRRTSHSEHPQCLPVTTSTVAAVKTPFHPSILHLHRSTPQTHHNQSTTPATMTPTTTMTTNKRPTSTSTPPSPTTQSHSQPRSQIPNFLRPKAATPMTTTTTTTTTPSTSASTSATTTPTTPTNRVAPTIPPPVAEPPAPTLVPLPAPTPTLSTSSTQLAASPASSSGTGTASAASADRSSSPSDDPTPPAPASPTCADAPPPPVLLPRMRHYERPLATKSPSISSAAHQTQLPHARHPTMQRSGAPAYGPDRLDGGSSVGQMNNLYRRSPFMQRRSGGGGMADDRPAVSATEAIYSNLAQQSPFAQRKLLLLSQQQQQSGGAECLPPPIGNNHHQQHPQQQQHLHNPMLYGLNGGRIAAASPLANRKRYQTTVPILEPSADVESGGGVRPKGNTSPIVLQRFYHQQNQLRDRQERRQRTASSSGVVTENTNPFLSQIPKFRPQYVDMPPSAVGVPPPVQAVAPASPPAASALANASHIPQYRYADQRSPLAAANATGSNGSSPKHQFFFGASPLGMRRKQTQQLQQHQHADDMDDNGGGGSSTSMDYMPAQQMSGIETASAKPSPSKGNKSSKTIKGDGIADADDPGWFNSLAGVVKRRFASYVKLHLANGPGKSSSGSNGGGSGMASEACGSRIHRTDRADTAKPHPHLRSVSAGVAGSPSTYYHQHQQHQQKLQQYAHDEAIDAATKCVPPSPHVLADHHRQQMMQQQQPQHQNLHQQHRHRSPDPPPRYNRGQSPLVLRRNLQELGGSPLFNRRYTASPPMPPPRRGSESVPGSPHNFRTARIHYTPEPQRHAYRTVDQ